MIRSEYFRDTARSEWSDKIDGVLRAVSLEPAPGPEQVTSPAQRGQLQRLLVARALLLDLKFLVADEIISMLDASTRIDVLNLLAELKGRGMGSCSSPTTCRSQLHQREDGHSARGVRRGNGRHRQGLWQSNHPTRKC